MFSISSGSWSDKTGPNSPLRLCGSDTSVTTAVELWTSRGFPASKILLFVSSVSISRSSVLISPLPKRHPLLRNFVHDQIFLPRFVNRERVPLQALPSVDGSRSQRRQRRLKC